MPELDKLIELILEEFRKDNGADAKLEEGDEFATVFNNGIVIIGVENSELKVKIILGEPYRVDFTFE